MSAAGQLQSAGEAKQIAEMQLRQSQEELAVQRETEKRLRDRLARREAKSTERKEVRHSLPTLYQYVLDRRCESSVSLHTTHVQSL